MRKLETIPARFLLSALICPILASAQAPTPSPQQTRPTPEPPKETRAFQPEQVRTEEAADVIQRVYPTARVAWLERTNSIVVRDTSETLDQIAALLNELEAQETTASGQRGDTQVLTLHRRDAETVAKLLRSVFSGSRIEADAVSNKLIVRGGASEMNRILAMASELDVVAASPSDNASGGVLSISVDFIQAVRGAKETGKLPDHLKEVAAELSKTGLGALRLYAHLETRAQDGEKFEMYHGFSAAGGKQIPPGIRFEGRVTLRDDRAEIHMDSRSNLPVEGEEHFGVTTTATMRLGDYLVLGSFPLSTTGAQAMLTATGSEVLIVVRVSAD